MIIFFLYKTSYEFPRVSVGSKFCINKQIFIVICDTSKREETHNLFNNIYGYLKKINKRLLPTLGSAYASSAP